jgi:hypothetical protein
MWVLRHALSDAHRPSFARYVTTRMIDSPPAMPRRQFSTICGRNGASRSALAG